jgi:hypothetical protein
MEAKIYQLVVGRFHQILIKLVRLVIRHVIKQEVLERTNLPTFLTLFNNAV